MPSGGCIALLTVTGELISRCELFDEEDLDAALARFDDLHAQTRRLENAATRTVEQFFAHLGPATGMPWPNYSPTTFPLTIGVRS